MNYLTFNGIDIRDFNAWVSGAGTYASPQRDVTTYLIPGRNGVLTQDNGRFENVDIIYPVFFITEFKKNYEALKAAMMSQTGYKRLEDTYHPEYFRLGYLDNAIEPEIGLMAQTGGCALTFKCKPQRWLKEGEKAIEITGSTSIKNPTLFASKPLIRAYGTGSFTIGNNTVTISTADTYTDIDCEIMDAFKGSTNCNGNISLSEFPTLEPGVNGISLSGITKLEITPRWWTL